MPSIKLRMPAAAILAAALAGTAGFCSFNYPVTPPQAPPPAPAEFVPAIPPPVITDGFY